MYEQDYLMRIIAQLLGAIRRSMERAAGEQNPEEAARLLDAAIGEATELDGEALLSLAPESLGAILSVSGIDPRVVEHVVRSLMLSSRYYHEAGNDVMSALREGQAKELALAFGQNVDNIDISDEELDKLASLSCE
jgi:hypothetical protein